MRRVTIVDFGAGNLLSVQRAFRHLGAAVELAATPEEALSADRLVLPGVGAFLACMDGMRKRGFVEPVKSFCASGRPFLGICVGMQMLFDTSEEFGRHEGLGLISGEVVRIPNVGANGQAHKVPHIGWSALLPTRQTGWEGSFLANVRPEASVYFVHSFAGKPKNPEHALAACDYNGQRLLAAVQKDNICGCQFHPEKSGGVGLDILDHFLKGVF